MWCYITLLSELFNAESKSQVYGHLHCFLQSAPKTAESLPKLDNCFIHVRSLKIVVLRVGIWQHCFVVVNFSFMQ